MSTQCDFTLINGEEVHPATDPEAAEKSTVAMPPFDFQYSTRTSCTSPPALSATHVNHSRNPAPLKSHSHGPLPLPPTRSPRPIHPSFYTCANCPALRLHTTSSSLAGTPHKTHQCFGTPSVHLPSLTSNPHPTVNLQVPEQCEERTVRKRKHSALLMDEESVWSCGINGCGSGTDSKHLSELVEGEGCGTVAGGRFENENGMKIYC